MPCVCHCITFCHYGIIIFIKQTVINYIVFALLSFHFSLTMSTLAGTCMSPLGIATQSFGPKWMFLTLTLILKIEHSSWAHFAKCLFSGICQIFILGVNLPWVIFFFYLLSIFLFLSLLFLKLSFKGIF